MHDTYVPYIGVTDFTDVEQVHRLQRFIQSITFFDPSFNRILHVGVMMSRKTLMDEPTKWAKAFPPKEAVADILSAPDVYNCLHYANFDYSTGIVEELRRALEYGGEFLDGIQLDMTWPDPDDIAEAKHRSGTDDIEVIMQVGKQAQAMFDDDPKKVVGHLERYEGVIDRVLLDKSMGQGLGMDAQAMLPFLYEISERLPQLGLIVAGGIGPKSTHLLDPILETFPHISFDGQGQMRPSGDALNEPLDWHYVRSYVYQMLAKCYFYENL